MSALKGGVCPASKEVRMKLPHLHAVGVKTETHPSWFLHTLSLKAPSPRGITTSSSLMTNVALSFSLEFEVVGFQLPP